MLGYSFPISLNLALLGKNQPKHGLYKSGQLYNLAIQRAESGRVGRGGDLPDIRRFSKHGAEDTTQGTHDSATSSTRLLKA